MKKIRLSCLLLILFPFLVFGQHRSIPVDTLIETTHVQSINGEKVNYTAITGMQPVWDKNGEPIATLHFTYYKRTDIDDVANRPLMISFNGGPGSASAWMHIAYTGPKLLEVDDEGFPVQPYGIKDNPHSVLDKTDLLYVNPVNTGYSRTIPETGKEVQRDKFFGINADISYLGDWIHTFVNRHGRWLSPKYLIGESYGGTRVSGLAHELQEKHWMYLNGVILVSPADYNVFTSDVPVSSAMNFPYFTATAWYYQQLPAELQQKKLEEVLPEVEHFTLQELMPALARGASLTESQKTEIAQKMAHYSGIDAALIVQSNLDLKPSFFWKELMRSTKGKTIGRLDSRYMGLDKYELGTRPDYNPEINAWLQSFTPAINHYMREHLGFQTDTKYNMFGDVHPWDRTNNNTRDNLRKAMAQNPNLEILFQAGYFDGATTYFNSKYTMWQIDPSGKMKDRMHFEAYHSGHMMYLRKEDLKTANEHVRSFIENAYKPGKSVKYE